MKSCCNCSNELDRRNVDLCWDCSAFGQTLKKEKQMADEKQWRSATLEDFGRVLDKQRVLPARFKMRKMSGWEYGFLSGLKSVDGVSVRFLDSSGIEWDICEVEKSHNENDFTYSVVIPFCSQSTAEYFIEHRCPTYSTLIIKTLPCTIDKWCRLKGDAIAH